MVLLILHLFFEPIDMFPRNSKKQGNCIMTKMGGDALRYIGCMSLLLSIEATFFITNNETREYALQFCVLL